MAIRQRDVDAVRRSNLAFAVKVKIIEILLTHLTIEYSRSRRRGNEEGGASAASAALVPPHTPERRPSAKMPAVPRKQRRTIA